jgi:hypothetical protein
MDPFLGVGRILSFLYFFILLVIFPFQSYFERVSYDGYIFLCKNFKDLKESKFMYYSFINMFDLFSFFFFKKNFSSCMANFYKFKLEFELKIAQDIENAIETKILKLEKELDYIINEGDLKGYIDEKNILKKFRLERHLRNLYREQNYKKSKNIK